MIPILRESQIRKDFIFNQYLKSVLISLFTDFSEINIHSICLLFIVFLFCFTILSNYIIIRIILISFQMISFIMLFKKIYLNSCRCFPNPNLIEETLKSTNTSTKLSASIFKNINQQINQMTGKKHIQRQYFLFGTPYFSFYMLKYLEITLVVDFFFHISDLFFKQSNIINWTKLTISDWISIGLTIIEGFFILCIIMFISKRILSNMTISTSLLYMKRRNEIWETLRQKQILMASVYDRVLERFKWIYGQLISVNEEFELNSFQDIQLEIVLDQINKMNSHNKIFMADLLVLSKFFNNEYLSFNEVFNIFLDDWYAKIEYLSNSSNNSNNSRSKDYTESQNSSRFNSHDSIFEAKILNPQTALKNISSEEMNIDKNNKNSKNNSNNKNTLFNYSNGIFTLRGNNNNNNNRNNNNDNNNNGFVFWKQFNQGPGVFEPSITRSKHI